MTTQVTPAVHRAAEALALPMSDDWDAFVPDAVDALASALDVEEIAETLYDTNPERFDDGLELAHIPWNEVRPKVQAKRRKEAAALRAALLGVA